MTALVEATTPELVKRASALVPALREKALTTEKSRRVPPELFDALSEAGIFKMMAPKRFGGEEADFQTQCDVLAELARGCPSTSWVATIFSAMTWVAATFPDETQEEVLGDGDPRIHGVFSPTGTGVRKDGGLVVNGRWPFGTGCHGARWSVLNAVVGEGESAVPTGIIVPTSELTILDDWHASGMAGTGSNTVVAENVFVPAHRLYPLPEMLEGRYSESRNTGNPYFEYPLTPVLIVNAGGTPLGIARGALEAFRERLPSRGITFTTYTSQAEAPVTHLQVGEASLKLDSAEDHIRRAAKIPDRHPGGPMSIEQRIKSRTHVSYATGLAREIVDSLFFASGASAIQETVPIQRFQRDIQALSNHAVMNTTTTVELYGRILCGLEPNTPLY
jgi:alkylation response protein AidB-like acyl-CoA dehydrogenase